MAMDCLNFEKFSLKFSKPSYSSLRQSQTCTMVYFSAKKNYDILDANFKAVFTAVAKVSVPFWPENSKIAVTELL